MNTPHLFFKLTKVDTIAGIIEATATSETPDKDNEICDYASSKPHFQKWSGTIEKATDGKSLGNVRAMHSNIAAGKLTGIDYNDDEKRIDIVAKITDKEQLQKLADGLYAGVSIGGKYEKKWADGEFTRYTAIPAEISIVDNPCNPDAVFSCVKEGGAVEMRKFVTPKQDPVAPVAPGPGEPTQKWECADGKTFAKKADAEAHTEELKKAAAVAATPAGQLTAALADLSATVAKVEEPKPGAVAKKDFTDEERSKLADEGKAMPDGSYPIENASDLHDAIQSFGRAKDKPKVMAHIKARAKALGAEDQLPDSWKDKDSEKAVIAEALRKNLDDVAVLCGLIQQLGWLQRWVETEAEIEGDGSEVPAGIKQAMSTLCDWLVEMAHEETSELFTNEEHIEYAAELAAAARATLHKVLGPKAADLLAKAGARHGKEDQGHLNAAHDHIKKAMGMDHDGDCDKLMPDAEKAAKEAAAAHMAHAHNMTKLAGAECPGGASKCMKDYGKAAKGGKDADPPPAEMTKAEHLHAAHDHLSKMGIGKCMKEAAARGDLHKAGARHSAADLEHLTKAHDALTEAGAGCPGGDSECAMGKDEALPGEHQEGEAEKLAKALAAERTKTETLEKQILEAVETVKGVTKGFEERLARIEAQPKPRPTDREPTYKIVSKQDDANEVLDQLTELAKTDPAKVADELFKRIHATGGHRVG